MTLNDIPLNSWVSTSPDSKDASPLRLRQYDLGKVGVQFLSPRIRIH